MAARAPNHRSFLRNTDDTTAFDFSVRIYRAVESGALRRRRAGGEFARI